MARSEPGDGSSSTLKRSRQRFDEDAAFIHELDCQLVAVQHGRADERVRVGGVHGDAAWLSIPDDRGFVNVEEALASVREDGATASAKRKVKRRD